MASILSTLARPFLGSPQPTTTSVEKSDAKSFAVGFMPGQSLSLRDNVMGQPLDSDYDLLYRIYDVNTDVSGSIDQWISVATGNDWQIRMDPKYLKQGQTVDDKTQKLIDRITTWLENPSPDKSLKFDELIDETIIDLAVCGDAYWEVIRDKNGIPIDVSNIHPATMRVVSDEHGVVVGYIQRMNGKVVATWTTKEIMHFKLPSRRSDLYGQSPLERAMEEITQDVKAMVANKSLMDNGFNPGAILLLDPEANSAENADKIQRQLSKRHAGAAMWHRLMALVGVKDVKTWGNTLKDMQFTDLRALATRKIATAFGVPNIFLNQRESTGDQSTSEVMERQLYKNKGKKLQKILNAMITEDLVQSFDERLQFVFNPPDFSDADALRRDALDLYKTDKYAISVNEIRTKHFGLDEIDEDELARKREEDHQRQQELFATQAEQAETPNDKSSKDGKTAKPTTNADDVKPAPAKKSLVLKAVQREDYDSEEAYLQALWLERDATFDRLTDAAIPAIAAYFSLLEQPLHDAIDTTLTDSQVEGAVDDVVGRYNEILSAVLQATVAAAIMAGSSASQLQLGYTLTPEQVNLLATRYSKEVLPQTAAGINDTTKAKLVETLREGIKRKETAPSLKLRASQVLEDGQTSRARMIADTEIVRAFEYANYESVQVSGMDLVDIERVWLSQRDDRVCPFCKAMDYQAVSFGDGFIFPGTKVEVLAPPTHPRCRCTTYFRRIHETRSGAAL